MKRLQLLKFADGFNSYTSDSVFSKNISLSIRDTFNSPFFFSFFKVFLKIAKVQTCKECTSFGHVCVRIVRTGSEKEIINSQIFGIS